MKKILPIIITVVIGITCIVLGLIKGINLTEVQKDTLKILLIVCAIFYSILCIFSIVTGIIYMLGKRKLNPLELSDRFVKKLDEGNKLDSFAHFMGFVTFIVGIIQGLTAYAIYFDEYIYLSIGFTIFSILSSPFHVPDNE